MKFVLKKNILKHIKSKSEKFKDAEDLFLYGWFDTPNEEVEVEIIFKNSVLNKTLKVRKSNSRGFYINIFKITLYYYDFETGI